MIKDVIIDIKGYQGIDDQRDTIEFTTDGRFGIKENEYYISYDEGQMFGDGTKVKTSLYIKPDSVVLQRSGDIQSRMVIEKGNRNTCFYSTPHGNLVLGIFGNKLDIDLSEKGGKIKLGYNIDSDLKLVSKNVVNISIREENS
ncbi:MAG: DUF1934 domain-containing protein [Clostridia bacterium]|nr:DUF1934 domain-containing protein [Clostridia bacterium]